MTKKILALAIVLAMIFVLAIPAFAADTPDIKAVMSGNGAKATLTVIVDGVQSEPLIWSNNNTTVVELNGYVVSVAIKGNKADKVTWEKVTIATAPVGTDTKEPAVESGDDTGAAVIFTDPDIGGGGKTNGVDEETELPKVIVPANSASFHCNTYGGNGRVWVDAWTADLNAAVKEAAAMGLKKASVGLEFTQASEDAKRWILITTDYVCPKCGRTDWISFSNKSGAPNGKNMQLHHIALTPPVDPKFAFTLEKLVGNESIASFIFEDGDTTITISDLVSQISFAAYTVSDDVAEIPVGANPASTGELGLDGTVTFTPDELPSGWYAIKEIFVEGSWAEQYFIAPGIQYYYIDEVGGISKGSSIDWNDPDKVAEFEAMYAVAANDDVKFDAAKIADALRLSGNKTVDSRANAANAFGAPDAIQNIQNGDEKFTGLGFLTDGVTYYFGDKDARYDIYNNPAEGVADLSLIEVTWTANWHTEAVDVYLVNTEIDGTIFEGNTWIGTVYNRKNLTFEGLEGFGYNVRLVGNFTYTDIFFPTNIEKATAIRLVDKTAEINTPKVTYHTYKAYDDGYDLDALIAYYTLPTNTFVNTLDDTVDPKGTIQAIIDITAKQDVITYDYEKATTTKTGSITADARDSTTHNWFGATIVNVESAKEIPVAVNQLRTGNGNNDILDLGFEISIDGNGDVWIDLGDDIVEGSASVQLLPINSQGKGVQDNNGDHKVYTGNSNTGFNVGEAEEVCVYVHFDSITYYNGSYNKVIAETETDVPVDYTGTITLAVTDEAGEEVYSVSGTLEELLEENILNLAGQIIIPGDFAPGTYTATLTGDGFDEVTLTGEIIEDGDVITFEFAPIVVTYDAREIDQGCPCTLTVCPNAE